MMLSPGTPRSRSPKFCAGDVSMTSLLRTVMVAGALMSWVSVLLALTTTSSPCTATLRVNGGTWTVPAPTVTSRVPGPKPPRFAVTL